MEIYNEDLFAEYLKDLFNKMGIDAQVEIIETERFCNDILITYNNVKLILNDYDIKKIEKTINNKIKMKVVDNETKRIFELENVYYDNIFKRTIYEFCTIDYHNWKWDISVYNNETLKDVLKRYNLTIDNK